MKAIIMVGMLAAVLLTAWLVLQSLTATSTGQQAPLATVDRARNARGAAEQASKDAGRTYDGASRE